MNYRLTIYGTNIYKEVQIGEQMKSLSIGTDRECQIRFVRDHFFTDFRIDMENRNGSYVLFCSDSVSFRSETGSGEKLRSLEVGDRVAVCYADSGVEFFYLDFSIDFGNIQDNYNLRINVPTDGKFTIGAANGCDIFIQDKLMGNDYITVNAVSGGYQVDISHARYGVSVNGFLIRRSSIGLVHGQFLALYGHIFYFDGSAWYTCDNGQITTQFQTQQIRLQNNHFRYPRFIRNARQQYVLPDTKLEVLPPQAVPAENNSDIWGSVLPMAVSMIVMIAVRSMMGSNGMYMIYFGVTMGMSVVMSVVSYFKSKKKHKKDLADRIEKYNSYIDGKEEETQRLRQEEREVSEKMNTSVEETLLLIDHFDARLFEREKCHKDYLDVWIGTGTVASVRQIEFRKQDFVEMQDPLQNYPSQMHDKYEYMENMPVILHLASMNAVGFIGTRTKLYQMMKNLIITISGQHFYKDVKMFFIMNNEDQKDFAWARWLQNTYGNDGGMRYFMYDDESRKQALQFLYSELSARDNGNSASNGKDQKRKEGQTDYIVFVYRSEELGGHPVTNFVEKAKNLGFTFLFFEEQEELVHHAVNQKVFLEPEEYRGTVVDVDDGEKVQAFSYPHISRQQAADAAIKLACVYIDELSLESTLTKNISLYKLMNIMSAYDLNLKERWAASDVTKSMAAPIGVMGSGDVLSLDIHEKAHGPHGLVAGTTGSGKSEILQTFILSLATLFHPYEVSFVIIDFKGGGMANQFKNLPHLNGAITNIDGKQIDRSLKSIRAELMKRQELFAKYNVNRIDAYISLYKEGKTPTPLPHLILIVDEFAELKSDQPEFMKELISTARIGRSLGVHLILATQKPSGVVNDQIWSNSRFKLCLKVQDKADSNEVLKSPLAAEIKEPGRCYLQVGNNEIFELFQSAYSGAPATVSGVDEAAEFSLKQVSLDGRRRTIYEQKKSHDQQAETQMEALVNYINDYCKTQHIEKLQDICLPPLAQVIPFTVDGYENKGTDICVPVGIYDDPDKHRQPVTEFNITQNNIFILGASQTGKTNMLQLIIRSITRQYSTEDVSVYILDFASMIMKRFEKLAYVGGVITAREEDRFKGFIRMIMGELENRKEILSKAGFGSFSVYRESGKRDLPQIILMIDNIAVMRELFPNCDEELMTLCRDGIAVGISVIATASQTAAVGFRYLSYFGKRICFHSNNTSEYTMLFDKCRIQPDDNPGRFLTEIDREMYEAQSYIAFPAEKESERIIEIDRFMEEVNSSAGGKGAEKILTIPEVVTKAYLAERQYQKKEAYELVFGLNYLTADIVTGNMLKNNVLGILGKEHCGMNNFMNYMIQSLLEHQDTDPVQIRIIDQVDRKLQRWAENENVKYTFDPSQIGAFVGEISDELEARYQQKLAGEEPDGRLMVLLINNYEAYTAISSDLRSLPKMDNIINKYRSMGVCIIMSQLPNINFNFTGPQVIRQCRQAMKLFLFLNMSDQRAMEMSGMVVREYAKPLDTGDVYYIDGSEITKLKTPLCE